MGKKKDWSEANTIRGLVEKAKSLGLGEGDLDETIHETKADEAADINSGGLHAQVKYLYESVGASSLEGLLNRFSKAKTPESGR